MKKNITFLLFFLLSVSLTFGQQEAQFSQNMFNKLAMNPAYAGSKKAICATGLIRQQWAGFKDPEGNSVAPRTFLISLDSPVRFLHGGLGATIYNDELGFEKNTGAKLTYAYRINIGKGNLAFGAQVGFLDKSVDFSKFKLLDDGDPVFMSKGEESVFLTDYAGGIYYQIPDKFYAGVSASLLTQAGGTIGSAETMNETHYYMMSGYNISVSGSSGLVVNPSVLVKTDWYSAQYDISTLMIFNDKYWGGISYRVEDAVAVIFGMQYRDFRIGYSYDITTSDMGTAGSSGSHELMLGYCFKIEVEKVRGTYKNARYL
ncbi:MAG: type IX secretion system membrane protein PorP/SprF [Bacteroidales bacterium]|nr:type IX secretion system membrane protein PorP/SprF [Bacteroidales bacterium]